MNATAKRQHVAVRSYWTHEERMNRAEAGRPSTCDCCGGRTHSFTLTDGRITCAACQATCSPSIAGITARMDLRDCPRTVHADDFKLDEDGLPRCPDCHEPRIRFVEDVPAIRQSLGVKNGNLLFDGLVDNHDYESGENGRLECGACAWTGPVEADEVEFA